MIAAEQNKLRFFAGFSASDSPGFLVAFYNENKNIIVCVSDGLNLWVAVEFVLWNGWELKHYLWIERLFLTKCIFFVAIFSLLMYF